MGTTIFHREEPPWFEAVRNLKPGGKTRIADGKLASFNGKGWHVYDFREKQSEVYEPVLTLAERLAVVRAQDQADVEAANSAAPPTQDAMFHPKDWPVDARVWFYKAGINNDQIAALGAFWSPRMRRLVVPYRTLDGGSAWIARDVTWFKRDPRPKYLFPYGARRGGGAVFNRNPHELPLGIVIVEDILSAYRIARDTDLTAIAAQGTSLDRDALVEIAGRAVPVVTWLDPDVYGQRGAAVIATKLRNMGVEVRNVVSLRDPKNHEPHEIQELL